MPIMKHAADDTLAAALDKWACPYLNHPEHDPSACLHCATDEQLEGGN